jgi:IclR family transcriptional regulator, pca regulon regulatory protein
LAKDRSGVNDRVEDNPLQVLSVEKAFKVMTAFDRTHPKMTLTQLAVRTGMDKSATQRFTHTLTTLGYLAKDPETKLFELTLKSLELGYHYTIANTLIQLAMPYLQHLGQMTEETVNMTFLDGVDVVIVARLTSRNVLSVDTVVGSRMPAYCSAAGVAILSKLPRKNALTIVDNSDRRALTPSTVYKKDEVLKKIDVSAKRGYATSFEEYCHGDLSIASPVLNHGGTPVAAVGVSVSRARYSPDETEAKFASQVVACALSIRPT